MSAWLICLIASSIVAGFIVWTAHLKGYTHFKILLIIAFFAVAVPTITLQQIDSYHTKEAKAQALALQAEADNISKSFQAAYSKEGTMYDGYDTILECQKIDVYLVTRIKLSEDNMIDYDAGAKQSMLLGEYWLEITSTREEESNE